MNETTAALVVVGIMAVLALAVFFFFRRRVKVAVKGPFGIALKAEGENPPPGFAPHGGIKMEKTEAGRDIVAEDTAGGGVEMKEVRAARCESHQFHGFRQAPPKTLAPERPVESGAIQVQQLLADRDITVIVGHEVHVHEGETASLAHFLHQLPPPPGAFTGRESELAELERLLTTSESSGVTIVGVRAALQGMAGVGKTALAVVLAHRLKIGYPDAQLFVNMRGADPERRQPLTPAEVMQTVIRCFHPEARLPDSLDALHPLYCAVLQEHDRRILLLLDNAAGAEQIAPPVPPPNCLLLVTSRRQFSLPGLSTRGIDCLRQNESAALLRRLAPRLNQHIPEAADLCGHLPLAIEVFAGVVNNKHTYPVSELLARFRAKQERLEEVEAAFELSYDLLSEDQRHRWCLLSVFPGSFDVSAASTVWGRDSQEVASPTSIHILTANQEETRAQLQDLVNANLVEWNNANRRFRLHDLMRHFCDSKLPEDDRAAAQHRLAVHFYGVLRESGKLYHEGGEAALRGLAGFDAERVSIEAGQARAAAAFASLAAGTEVPDFLKAARLCAEYANAGVSLLDLRHNPAQRIAWLEIGDLRGQAVGPP